MNFRRFISVLMPMRLLLPLALLGLLAAGCRGGAGMPSASAQQPALVAIPTAEPGQLACMDALMTGVLAADAEAGLVVHAPDGTSVVIVWPNGWAAVDQDGMRVLLNDRGDPIARVGDHVQIGGGQGNDGRWYTCGEVTRAP